jgi:hypothetical protein
MMTAVPLAAEAADAAAAPAASMKTNRQQLLWYFPCNLGSS